MKLYLDDRFIFFIFKDLTEEKLVKKRFTYKDESAAMSSAGYDIRKVKDVCFIKKVKDKYFTYSGFLYELLVFCKEDDLIISGLVDKRTKFNHQKKEYEDDYLSSYFPFDYNDHQVSALKKMLKMSCGIIKMPTSAGKGELLAPFIKETKLKTLIVVNKKLLAFQLFERIKKTGIDCGIWNSDKKINGKDAMVATIGSVKTVPELIEYKVLIIDEVHNSSSKSFQDFLNKTNYPIKIGLSATPNKGIPFTYAKIRQYIGSVVYEIYAKSLIENNVIAKPFIYFIKNKCVPTLDWQSAYLKNIIEGKERNEIIIKIIKKFNIPTLILIQDVVNGQGEFLRNEIEKLDKKVVFIHGSTKDRFKYIEQLEKEEIDVLISTNILNEGISIKNIKLLINASAMKSFSSTAQKIGRSLRVKEGKVSTAVIDFLDEGNRFLDKHGKIRMEIFHKLGFCDIVKIDIEDLLKYDEGKLIKDT